MKKIIRIVFEIEIYNKNVYIKYVSKKKNKPVPFIDIKPNNSTKKCEFEISFPNYLNL